MEPASAASEAMKVWAEYGFAGLYVLVSVLIVSYLLYSLRRSEKENMGLTVRAITSIERSNIVGESQTKLQVEMKDALTRLTGQQAEVLAYLEGRDGNASGMRRRRGDG
jgi:hypothetical protein